MARELNGKVGRVSDSIGLSHSFHREHLQICEYLGNQIPPGRCITKLMNLYNHGAKNEGKSLDSATQLSGFLIKIFHSSSLTL